MSHANHTLPAAAHDIRPTVTTRPADPTRVAMITIASLHPQRRGTAFSERELRSRSSASSDRRNASAKGALDLRSWLARFSILSAHVMVQFTVQGFGSTRCTEQGIEVARRGLSSRMVRDSWDLSWANWAINRECQFARYLRANLSWDRL